MSVTALIVGLTDHEASYFLPAALLQAPSPPNVKVIKVKMYARASQLSKTWPQFPVDYTNVTAVHAAIFVLISFLNFA